MHERREKTWLHACGHLHHSLSSTGVNQNVSYDNVYFEV